MEKATFGGGCFWGVEAKFRQIKGVSQTAVGYAGGATQDPNYQEVCTGTTQHAEVVEVLFDAQVTTYQRLLDVFWQCHNPTTMNRQGPDVGTQYRSVIFFHNVEQKKTAQISKQKEDESGRYSNKIVTQIVP
ncbi:MAG: peptide-methionine (S)-S-oxide reductase MsrA, partial [SAR324 cluster bacterium]|nr:peptide-methionine (S)-S-oxide reductase MsrA [SAR324 cluster bacterium]